MNALEQLTTATANKAHEQKWSHGLGWGWTEGGGAGAGTPHAIRGEHTRAGLPAGMR